MFAARAFLHEAAELRLAGHVGVQDIVAGGFVGEGGPAHQRALRMRGRQADDGRFDVEGFLVASIGQV